MGIGKIMGMIMKKYLVVRMPSIPFLDNCHSDEHGGYQSDASEAKGHVDRAAFLWIQTTNRETLENEKVGV